MDNEEFGEQHTSNELHQEQLRADKELSRELSEDELERLTERLIEMKRRATLLDYSKGDTKRQMNEIQQSVDGLRYGDWARLNERYQSFEGVNYKIQQTPGRLRKKVCFFPVARPKKRRFPPLPLEIIFVCRTHVITLI